MNRRATLQVESINMPQRSSLFDLTARHPKEMGTSYLALGCAPSDHEIEEYNVKHTVEFENTYRMEPKKRFVAERVEPIMNDVLEKHLEKVSYEPIQCSILAKTIVSEIKIQVKELDFERYKIICLVDIGEKRDQDIHMGSRCLWDHQRDTFASATYENHSLFAAAIVFAIYFE
ncbi:dynein light chain Tctex-type 5-like [Lytechinus pictus]|uniref:dynein light chain Tctex-type 5-like n=1 Tax=Lytechinus pictus TaxID=7653 RepID=UPI00240D13ED|nr:dynein light chain Tctex-type 5-like [Lytechinus pictus]XP_054764760.1 dynein light chain Tctex-type 5-like [Lytechinus pictus]